MLPGSVLYTVGNNTDNDNNTDSMTSPAPNMLPVRVAIPNSCLMRLLCAPINYVKSCIVFTKLVHLYVWTNITH